MDGTESGKNAMLKLEIIAKIEIHNQTSVNEAYNDCVGLFIMISRYFRDAESEKRKADVKHFELLI